MMVNEESDATVTTVYVVHSGSAAPLIDYSS